MKKIFKLYLLVLSGVAVTSCNDAIDITQAGELPPDKAFETVEDLEQGVYGVFASIPGESEYLFTSLFTDEAAIGVANGGQGRDGDLSFVLHPGTSHAGSIWRGYYTLISDANWFLEGASTLEPTEENEQAYNHFVAQAHGIRAYAHFKLLTFFSTNLKDDNALGVIKLDFIPSITDQLPRATNGEVFELILSDLAFAEANLNDNSPVTSGKRFVTKDFVTAMRARIAAYRGQYTQAETYAQTLIDKYNLSQGVTYMNIWRDIDSPSDEVIFKIDRSSGANFSQIWASINSTATGSAFFEVGRALFNLIEPTDIRLNVITDPTRVVNPDYQNSDDYYNTDILPVGKYPGSQGIQLMNCLKIFRVSEMYLIKAEARAAANDFTGAATAVTAVRTARGASAVAFGGPEEAWAGILTERRIELAFEGHRYIDLKRLGTLADAQVDRDPMDCAWDGNCTLPVTDYRFTMPIPLSELNVNSVIVSQQNPNY